MAKDNNLQDFLTDIADAIREKKGTTEKINPQNFATEIANLSSVEETSNTEYLDISGLEEQIKLVLSGFSFLAKTPEIKAICPIGALMLESSTYLQKVTEISVRLQEKVVYNNVLLTIEQFLTNVGIDLNTIPRITKEEFYNLEVPSNYEWVDLGLPSGLLWASTNVGAEKPEDFGLYFAWGEAQGYEGVTIDKQFTWDDYKFGTQESLTKYNNVDGLTTLELEDDAAYQSDNTCRMPTSDEFQELIDNTTFTWETLNGVNGGRFTGTNGNSIFIPAASVCLSGLVYDVGSSGCLWSSSLYESNPDGGLRLYIYSYDADVSHSSRCNGCSVRAVKSIN